MKQPIKQLLAVAVVLGAARGASADTPRTLANQRPACGNPMGKGGPQDECQWQWELFHARGYVAGAEHERRIAAGMVAGVPRLLASGRPAAGNTMGKGRAGNHERQLQARFADTLARAEALLAANRAQLARTEASYAGWKAEHPPAAENVVASR